MTPEAIPAQEWPADRDWDFSGCAITLDGKWMMLAHPECVTHRGVHIDEAFSGDCVQETPAALPPEALDRLVHAIRFGDPDCEGDDAEPTPAPELDAIEELTTALSAARAQLAEPIAAMQLRRDDDLPATPEQRAAARTAVWALRVAVARTLFALAPEGGAG